MACLHGVQGAQQPKTVVSGPSCRHLFGPLFTITKGYYFSFYHTKRFPARAVHGLASIGWLAVESCQVDDLESQCFARLELVSYAAIR
jgi:hypothetical protein